MSSIWKKPTTTPRQLELGWLNLFHQAHDQFCQCEDPDLHYLMVINKFSNFKKPESEIINIKCLLTGKPTGTTTTTEEEKDIHIDEGDLESLFEKDFEEEPTGENSER
nr:MAG: hypothetical protein [Betatorquevirus sp.]